MTACGIIGTGVHFGIYLRYYLIKEDGPASNLLIILIAGFSLAAILITILKSNIYIAGIGLEATQSHHGCIPTAASHIYKIIALIIGLPLSCICLVHLVGIWI